MRPCAFAAPTPRERAAKAASMRVFVLVMVISLCRSEMSEVLGHLRLSNRSIRSDGVDIDRRDPHNNAAFRHFICAPNDKVRSSQKGEPSAIDQERASGTGCFGLMTVPFHLTQ